MSLRSAFIGLALLTALCGGGLYVLQSHFGRETQMRDAERAFLTGHAGNNAPDSIVATDPSPSRGGSASVPAEPAALRNEEPLTLDSWYADAGSNEGPADTDPEDKSHLINDAQPLVSAEPI